MRVIQPQPGPQTGFLSTSADVAFYGGAAGGGKTYAACLEPLRHVQHAGFSAVIFRRTYPEIMNPGGLWDTMESMYPDLGAVPKATSCEWRWPSGSIIRCAHLQHEKDKHAWQGAQVPLIIFDELTHFSRSTFFYLLSRNRLGSPLPIRPYVRATCNPDSACWVADFIAWWIGEDGLPIPERSGVIRWFKRDQDQIIWADSKEELGQDAKSFTFISAKVTDNLALMRSDPGYIANLRSLPLFERSQLLDGNWKVRPVAGMLFRRHWLEVVEAAPAPDGSARIVRYWDRAATEAGPGATDPDWTVGLKMMLHKGTFYVLDVCRLRGTPDKVKRAMRNCADQDGQDVEVWAEEDPGQAGKSEVSDLSKMFHDRVFKTNRVTKSKFTRALPISAQAEAGNVKLVRGRWNEAFLVELEGFADWDQLDSKPTVVPHDDQVDALSGAHAALSFRTEPGIRSL